MNKNKWKIGFLILLGIDLFIFILLLSLVLTPSSDTPKNINNEPNVKYVSFRLKSNKQDLNKLINHYLKSSAAGSSIDYRVRLGDDVELYGTIPVFSEQLNMKMTFIPQALSNGDLILKQKSISVGSLQLPASYVLEFIMENYNLPNGIEIMPNNQLVYIHTQQLKLKSGMKIKIDRFNLKHNDIAFRILVPVT